VSGVFEVEEWRGEVMIRKFEEHDPDLLSRKKVDAAFMMGILWMGWMQLPAPQKFKRQKTEEGMYRDGWKVFVRHFQSAILN